MNNQKSPNLKAKKYINIKLAAEILQVSSATLRNWDKQGKLKAKRHGKNNYRLYDISQLEEFAEKNDLKRISVDKKITLEK